MKIDWGDVLRFVGIVCIVVVLTLCVFMLGTLFGWMTSGAGYFKGANDIVKQLVEISGKGLK